MLRFLFHRNALILPRSTTSHLPARYQGAPCAVSSYARQLHVFARTQHSDHADVEVADGASVALLKIYIYNSTLGSLLGHSCGLALGSAPF
jgi:hypothetical protein